MIRFGAIEALHREGTRPVCFKGATRSHSSLRSARKVTWVRIAGLAVGLFLFASHAASQEESHSFSAGPSRSSCQSMTALREPQAARKPPHQGGRQAPGTIAGTIADPSDAPIPSAVVKLTRASQAPLAQAVSDEDGRFVFLDVAPGEFQLTISAEGFRMQEVSGTVHPDEHYVVPQVTLALAEQLTEITVTPQTQEEVGEQQIKVQETQRVFGFLPNFYVSYIPDAVPLTSKQKMKLAWKTSVDPITIASVGVVAGIEQQRNWFRAYGQGAQGFAKRFGATYADVVAGTFLGSAVMPSLLKQDPRYFYKGTGRWSSRLWYALSRSVITRGDSGNWQPNYSNFLGNLAAAGIATSYRPAQNRNVAFVFQTAGIRIVETAFANVFQEFVSRKVTPGVSRRHTSEP